MQAQTAGRESTTQADILTNLDGFLLTLEAENKSPRTRVTYAEAVRGVDAFLERAGMLRLVANLKREHIEAFLVSLQARGGRRNPDGSHQPAKPATVQNRFRSLQAFMKWLRDEGEIRESPMANMRPPAIPGNRPRFSGRRTCGSCSQPARGRRSTTGAIWRSSGCLWQPGCGGASAPGSGSMMWT